MRALILLSFLILFSLIFSSACKKNPFDFRSKYTGDYEFTYSYSSWNINVGVYDADTLYYAGNIYYENDGKIIINYYSGTELELGIDKDGNLSLSCGASAGKFDNSSSVSIDYSTGSCPGSGLGGGTNYTIRGTKK